MHSNWSYSPEAPNLGQNRWSLEPRDLAILRMTFNKANLRDLIAANGLVILLLIQIIDFSARVTLKFDEWPRKIIGNLFYTTSSFVYHFKSIGELKLKLHSGNAQFGSKSAIFCPLWPWNLTLVGHLFYIQALCIISNSCKSKLKLQSGNAQFGSKSAIFCPKWPWNLTDALEKQ